MFNNTEGTIRCVGCGIEVTADFFVVDRAIYCCQDCSQGLKCSCGDRLEQEDEHRSIGGAPDTLIP